MAVQCTEAQNGCVGGACWGLLLWSSEQELRGSLSTSVSGSYFLHKRPAALSLPLSQASE